MSFQTKSKSFVKAVLLLLVRVALYLFSFLRILESMLDIVLLWCGRKIRRILGMKKTS